ncbi:MAG: SRPBCC domain-containing protein [Ignavibacteria bacterium]|nr:SRPBCC domain-containing protein [Ignavibacteria bacterium]
MNATEVLTELDTICKEIIINAPASKVWKALTEQKQIEKWFMAPDNFIPEAGTTFHMTGTKDGESFPHTCTILEAIPEKKLSYTWNMSAIDGESIVAWELEEQDKTTKLTLTHSQWDKVKFNTPSLSPDDFINGWNYFINKLKEYSETL